MIHNKKIASAFLILAVIFMDILTGMEFDLFVPSFSQLQTHFALAPFWVEALLSINFIGYLLSLFLVGYLADLFGIKIVIIVGILAFILGTVACIVGISYSFLFIGRWLQGLGIAAPSILSFLIIANYYPLKKQQFFMAMLSGSLNISAGVAPVIGSFIALYFHWRGSFVFLLILGFIALFMTISFVPDYSKTQNDEKINLSYLRLFKSKTLLLLIIYFAVTSVPYWVFVGISPLLYVKNLHIRLSTFGYYQGILSFTFAIGSIIFGFILHSTSPKRWLMLSLAIYILSFIAIGFVTFWEAANALWITLAMLIFVIGQIIPSAILYPLCINYIPHAKAKIAAVIQGSAFLLSSINLQITGYLYSKTFLQTGVVIMVFVAAIIVAQYLVIKNPKLVPQKLPSKNS